MNKRADLSINVIIVAILALVVLVILIFIFSNKINLFGTSISACGGKCLATTECEPDYAYNPGGDKGCPKPLETGTKCCIKASVDETK